MADIEKVIKGLNFCTKLYLGCKECPYFGESDGKASCECKLKTDALAMLKEQEAKPPAIMQDIEGIWSTCSMCGHKLRPILAMEMDTYFPKFCSECGQAVKW